MKEPILERIVFNKIGVKRLRVLRLLPNPIFSKKDRGIPEVRLTTINNQQKKVILNGDRNERLSKKL
jgi:hypothetical protein